MRTYKEFVYILEQVSGGSFMVTRRFGSRGLPGSTSVTASGQGGTVGGTQYSGSATVGKGTVSGQGDKINKGLSASISNTQSGGGDKQWKGVPYRTPDADTSTSTIRKGAIGSLNVNVSGGGGANPTSKVTTPEERPQQSGQQQSSAMTSAQAQAYAQKRAAFKSGSKDDAPAYAPSDVRDQLSMMRAKTPQDIRLAKIARQHGV